MITVVTLLRVRRLIGRETEQKWNSSGNNLNNRNNQNNQISENSQNLVTPLNCRIQGLDFLIRRDVEVPENFQKKKF